MQKTTLSVVFFVGKQWGECMFAYREVPPRGLGL